MATMNSTEGVSAHRFHVGLIVKFTMEQHFPVVPVSLDVPLQNA